MREFLYKLVERLHAEGRPLSRNKHFHSFEGGARRALRIDRHLRDLETHLEALRARNEPPRVRWLPGDGVQVVISDPRLSVVRTATLTAEEVAIVRQTEAGRWALGAAQGQRENANAPPGHAAALPAGKRR